LSNEIPGEQGVGPAVPAGCIKKTRKYAPSLHSSIAASPPANQAQDFNLQSFIMFHHQLHPVPEPIGVFQNYVAKVPETLILREKIMSLSGDSFTVTNAAGLPFLKIKGHHVTISGRKSVYDMQDHHLYDLVKELLHLHATYAAEDPSGKKILSVRSSFQRKQSIVSPFLPTRQHACF
jgi:hypothetical protein